jgi:Polysaccharide pyruvyl transferase
VELTISFARTAARLREIAGALRHEWRTMTACFSRRPRAAYIGWVGHNNLGDEVLQEAHQVLFPGVALSVYRRSRLSKPLRSITGLRPYNFGILGGGTLINQGHEWLTAVRDLQANHIPMVCLGTGVASPEFWTKNEASSWLLGHGGNELAEWAEVLAQFRYVGVRGPYSLAALNDSGLYDVDVVGDTALSLSAVAATGGGCLKPGLIGLNIGHVESNPMWGDPAAYMDEVVRFVQLLCELDHEVRLLPVWDRDIPSNEDILERAGTSHCVMLRVFDTYAHYSAAVRDCEVFVGQKLHATAIACANRIPSVMIEYRPKCRDFMASLDLEDYVIRTDAFTAEAAKAMVDRLHLERKAVLERLDERVSHFRTKQSHAAGRMTELLLEHRPRRP